VDRLAKVSPFGLLWDRLFLLSDHLR
jgi:hypothetical protein